MARRVEVVAALIRRGERYLVNQRPEGSWGAGRWEFPGGKVEPGETPEQSLARECREEIGVEVRVGALAARIEHDYPDRRVALLFHDCEIAAGEPAAQEGNALAWATPAEMDSIAILEADRPVVELLKRRGAQP
ncbi:MAG: 8-oxo-dGTP diphosphatase MutT [Candidatus Sumerlaeia bacterium]|nr:8-oxo-dGTP diphosphatase MutT [Candidatus Sumerlaeia bacterium]